MDGTEILGGKSKHCSSNTELTLRKYFRNTREPFAVTLGGQRLYFLTSPVDVAAFYKNTTAFVFDDVVYDLSVRFGVYHSALKRLRQKPANKEDDRFSSLLQIKNPQLKSLAQLNSELFHLELHPGERLDDLLSRFVFYIEKSLDLHKFPLAAIVSSSKSGRVVSLLKWTQEVLMLAGTDAIFGEKIQEIDPNLIKNFLVFDDENWKLWYKWPRAKRMHTAKAKMTKTVQEYLSLPCEKRPGAAHLLEVIETSQRALGISDHDIATNLT